MGKYDNTGSLEWRIANRIRYPGWAKKDPRFLRLDMLDRCLDGTFYNHLPYTFWDEVVGNGEYVPISDRAPSVKFNIPRMLGKQLGRKLFAGRHCPTLVHNKNDNDMRQRAEALIEESKLDSLMLDIVKRGQAGSVALTFKVVAYAPNKAKVMVNLWEAKFCRPRFDQVGELEVLRVNYPVLGAQFIDNGVLRDFENQQVEPAKNYWFVRDFTKTTEITYLPIKESQWAPIDSRSPKLIEDESQKIAPHDLGFVQGHWFINAGQGEYPDGEDSFSSALSTTIELDVRMSQLGIGIGYNSAPQMVIKGNLINIKDSPDGGVIVRGPTRYLQFAADKKFDDYSESGGDAKLVEMSGKGIEIGLEFIRMLKEIILWQLCGSLKDPNKVTTAMSGKGMELLDEEHTDLVADNRTNYVRNGYLIVIKKMCIAAEKARHPLMKGATEERIDGLTLNFPIIHEIGPTEMAQLSTALSVAIESKIVSTIEARNIFKTQVDVPIDSANKDYTPAIDGDNEETQLPDKEEKNSDQDSSIFPG